MSQGLSYPLSGSSLRSAMPKRDLSISTVTRYIVRLLEGIMMVLHLSEGAILTTGDYYVLLYCIKCFGEYRQHMFTWII